MADQSDPGDQAHMPSSFDGNPDFHDENRWAKLGRKLKEEPLIPIGCLATCYALYQASKSIRQGDHHQTNRMFRARIYAQGFTLVALVAGSIFYKDERMQRKKFEKSLEEKKASEQREKWLRELETRDKEDQEWRARFEGVRGRVAEVTGKASEDGALPPMATRTDVDVGKSRVGKILTDAKNEAQVQEMVEKTFKNKSALEDQRSVWDQRRWVVSAQDACRRR
jgi:hypothetical protein